MDGDEKDKTEKENEKDDCDEEGTCRRGEQEASQGPGRKGTFN